MVGMVGQQASRARRKAAVWMALLTGNRRRTRREGWERRWASESYHPDYEIGTADLAVRHALADGWFAPGMRALDIGCGSGHSAAWLARHGLESVGIDFAPSAIGRARNHFEGIPNLSFEVVDVLEPGGYAKTFDVLVDRGCLHGIDERHRPRYVDSILSWARPNARFLLIMRTKGARTESVISEARTLLASHFDYLSSEAGDVAGPQAQTSLPAVAMRFARTSLAPAPSKGTRPAAGPPLE